jgi:hypothetical protein
MWRSGTSRKAIRYRLRMCVSISISSTPRYKPFHSTSFDKYLVRHRGRVTPGVFHTIKPAHQSSSLHHLPSFSTIRTFYVPSSPHPSPLKALSNLSQILPSRRHPHIPCQRLTSRGHSPIPLLSPMSSFFDPIGRIWKQR